MNAVEALASMRDEHFRVGPVRSSEPFPLSEDERARLQYEVRRERTRVLGILAMAHERTDPLLLLAIAHGWSGAELHLHREVQELETVVKAAYLNGTRLPGEMATWSASDLLAHLERSLVEARTARVKRLGGRRASAIMRSARRLGGQCFASDMVASPYRPTTSAGESRDGLPASPVPAAVSSHP